MKSLFAEMCDIAKGRAEPGQVWLCPESHPAGAVNLGQGPKVCDDPAERELRD